ncbi:MAG: hypothetical protein LBM38_03260 [Clostridiales bacterium]|jgi:hypothetical protein|nr:hypothetical protein [Clostridiales bacterium]
MVKFLNLFKKKNKKTKNPILEPSSHVPDSFTIARHDLDLQHAFYQAKAEGILTTNDIEQMTNSQTFKILTLPVSYFDINQIIIKEKPYDQKDAKYSLEPYNKDKAATLLRHPSIKLAKSFCDNSDASLHAYLLASNQLFDWKTFEYIKGKAFVFQSAFSIFNPKQKTDENNLEIANVDFFNKTSVRDSMNLDDAYRVNFMQSAEENATHVILQNIKINDEEATNKINRIESVIKEPLANSNTSDALDKVQEIFGDNDIAFLALANNNIIIKGADLQANTIFTTLSSEFWEKNVSPSTESIDKKNPVSAKAKPQQNIGTN